MSKGRFARWFAVLAVAVAILTFAVSATPAAAAGIVVEPLAGGFDTTYTITVSGFQPNEIVDTWIGLPNLSAVGTGTRTADWSGTLTWSFKPKISHGSGEYIAVAHGRTSGEFAYKFYVDASPAGHGNPPPPAPAPQPQPIANVSERTVRFSGTGFRGGELVNTWFQYPNGYVQRWNNYSADSWGNLTFNFTVGTNWLWGGYRIVARGVSSGNTAYVDFSYFGTISSAVANKPVANPSPFYNFQQAGFRPGEPVYVWMSFPNGTTQPLGMTTANGDGVVNFRVNIGPTWPYGGYTIAAYGWQSKMLKWSGFAYFGSVT